MDENFKENWKNFEIDKDLALELSQKVYDFFEMPKVKEFMNETKTKQKGGETYE